MKTIAAQRVALENGFQPAFFDFLTQTIYISCFADGTPSPFHILEGLPRELIVDRARSGRVVSMNTGAPRPASIMSPAGAKARR